MLTLTTPVSVPNVQKVHVDAVQLDGNINVAIITTSAQGGGGIIYGVYTLTVRDGPSQGLRATVSPLGYLDRLEVFTTTTSTGFTDFVAAYTGNTVTLKNKAAESALLSAGLLPAGTVA